jgi:L-fuculose-phosphate aldolase
LKFLKYKEREEMNPAEKIVTIGRLMFERRLTDLSGGNISMRVGELIYITPRYSGARQHWDVDPATIVKGRLDNDEILNDPGFSREGKSHLIVYRAFPDANAIIHAHPFYALPFCAAGKAIPPVLESNEKFGVIEPVPFAPAHSQELADNIAAALAGKEDRIKRHSAGLLLPKHGIFVISKDIDLALDAVERINWNAWCILAQKMLP